MIDTLRILQPMVIDTLSVGTIPVDVNLIDSVNNVVLQIKDGIPITFVDKTEHNWFQDHLTELIAFCIAVISLVYNIYQTMVSRRERKETRNHEIELKKLETEEHRKELIDEKGIAKQYELYLLLLKLDDLATNDAARTPGTNERISFIEKITEANVFIRENRLFISDKQYMIGTDILYLYKVMKENVEGRVWLGIQDLRELYEAVYNDDKSVDKQTIENKFAEIVFKPKNHG